MSILIPDLCAKFHLNSLKNDCFTMIFVFFTFSLIFKNLQIFEFLNFVSVTYQTHIVKQKNRPKRLPQSPESDTNPGLHM